MYHHRINAQNVEKSGFRSLPVEYCTCMCIYPDLDKRVDSQFMASSVWHTDLYVYPTFKNLLNRDYCRLCISVCRRGAVTMPGFSLDRIKASVSARPAALAKTHPKSRTLALQGQVPVEPAKLASLWSQ